MSEHPIDPRLEQAAARLAPGYTEPQVVGTAGHLLRVRDDECEVVIRRWPTGTTREHAELVLAALARGHAATPMFPEPRLEPEGGVILLDGEHFSAMSWLPGQPLARYGDYRTPDGAIIDVPLPASAPAPEIVTQAARAIGEFHAATADLVTDQPGRHPLQVRLSAVERAWEAQRRRVGREAAGFPEIRRWLRCGNRVVPVAGELLRQAGDTGRRLVVSHGDLWPANLLVEGTGADRTLSGIAGWSSVAIDSPLVDLAHLVTHTSGWSGARAEEVLGAYTDAAPLQPLERRLLPVVAALDLMPTVGELLLLAFVDERMVNHEAQPVLRSGMKSLLSSLENLTNILAPDAEWEQRQANIARKDRRPSGARTPRGSRTKPAQRPGSGRSRRG